MSRRISPGARAHLLRITRAAVIRKAMDTPAVHELERLAGKRPRYFDRRGQPMSFVDWTIAIELGERRVAQATLDNGLWVSTVWLGIDHGWGLAPGKPVIFETMVFAGKGGTDLDQRRYTSELAARTGHMEMVQQWAAKEKPAEGWA